MCESRPASSARWMSSGSAGLWLKLDVDPLRRLAQLRHEVLPLAHAQVVEELGVAALAELVAGEAELLLAQVAPEVHEREEVGALVGEARVESVRLLALVGRPLARVDDRERGRDHDHLAGAAAAVALEHHPAEPRVDRQLREPAAERRQPLAVVERRELLQQPDPVAHLAPVGRVEEREVLDVAEPRGGHLQDHRGEVRAQDLGVGEPRALVEVLLRVEPDADAVRDAPAAALALVGRRLRDRLDRQPLDLQPRAVAADPRRAGIDDVADPRHRQRRLGDVRREHDPAAVVRPEDALLLARREARVERQDVDVGRAAARTAPPPCRGSRARPTGTRARRPGARAAAPRRRRRSRRSGRRSSLSSGR